MNVLETSLETTNIMQCFSAIFFLYPTYYLPKKNMTWLWPFTMLFIT